MRSLGAIGASVAPQPFLDLCHDRRRRASSARSSPFLPAYEFPPPPPRSPPLEHTVRGRASWRPLHDPPPPRLERARGRHTREEATCDASSVRVRVAHQKKRRRFFPRLWELTDRGCGRRRRGADAPDQLDIEGTPCACGAAGLELGDGAEPGACGFADGLGLGEGVLLGALIAQCAAGFWCLVVFWRAT